jgi:hypothetical protein
MSFSLPDGVEMIVATHLLELRRDLGLPNEFSHVIIYPRDDLFLNWSPEAKGEFVGGLTNLFEDKPDSSPQTLLQFRRVYMHERPDTFAALAAFDDLLEPFAPSEMLDPVKRLRDSDAPLGMFDWITVVAGTRYLSPSIWPRERPSEQSALLGEELDACIDILNDFLISLSLARNDTTIGPIARGDLPSVCPVILETLTPGETRSGVAYFYEIHQNHNFPRRPPSDFDEIDDQEVLATLIARSLFHGQEPYFLFYELMQEAIRQFNEIRYTTSALHTGTAVEVLLSTTLREVGRARGIPEAEVDRLLELPLRNQVEQHFGRIVGCAVDLADRANPFGRWWRGGYQLRNDAVHQAVRATRDQAHDALDDANALVAAIRVSLADDPVTEPVAELLQWGKIDREIDAERAE